MEEKRKRREQLNMLYKPLFFSLSALIALVSVTVAWFAANTQVGSSGMQVSVSGERFELASEGEEGLYYEPGKKGDSITINGKTYYTTSSAKSAITWMVGADSNLRNDMDQGRLSPGASGKITFYILPKEESMKEFTVQISINCLLYRRSQNKTDLVIEDRYGTGTADTVYLEVLPEADATEADELMKGHMLFFQSFDGTHYSNWIEGDVLEITVSGTDPIPVTIYWVWPYVLDWIVDTGETATLCNSAVAEGDYQKLLRDIRENPGHYLRKLVTETEEENVFDSSALETQMELYRLKYNMGDEFIGTRANYMFLQITAE